MTISRDDAIRAVAHYARALTGSEEDFAPAVAAAAAKPIVLIGEATHGTHEFYRIRAELPETFPTAL